MVVLETWQDHHLAHSVVAYILQMLCSFVCVCHEYEYDLTNLIAAISLQGDLHVSHIKFIVWFPACTLSQVNTYPDLWPTGTRKCSALSGKPRGKLEETRLMDDRTLCPAVTAAALSFEDVTLAFRLFPFSHPRK